MHITRTLLLGLLLAVAAFGQAGTPDCQFQATFTSATPGTTGNGLFNNRITRCVGWRMTYYTGGASAISVTLQGGTDVAGAPGSYSTLTATQGTVNPAVGTANGTVAACCDYFPWVRVNPTTFTATSMSVTVYGWKAPETGPTSTSSGGATSNVTVVGPLGQAAMAASIPVVVASNQTAIPVTPAANSSVNVTQINGTTSYGCGSQASFNLSGSGDTQIIAASGATVIRICHLSLSTVGAEDIKITRGTGANCATGTADVTGLYKTVTALAFDWGPFSPLVGAASGAICINQSVAQATGGIVIYDQR